MNTKPIRILLVEDNPDDVLRLRQTLGEATTSRQFELTHTDSIHDALQRLTEATFDVILLDLSLPDSKGAETLVNACAEVSQSPIVVLTGFDEDEVGMAAVQAGAQDYLVKGEVDHKLLVRALRNAIERNQLQAQLRELALTDSLTGLFNRLGFLTLATQQLKLASRTGSGLTLLFADLDGLKKVNDTFGHRHGEVALQKTAEILKAALRDSDIVARLGGDEFTVLAIATDSKSAEIITLRIQQRLEDYNARNIHPFKLALSVGAAYFDPAKPVPLEELIASADQAMYRHKRSKRTGDRSIAGR